MQSSLWLLYHRGLFLSIQDISDKMQSNFGDYGYQFVGAAIGRPYDNAECQEDRRRRPLQFMSYIRHIILSNFGDYGYQFVGTAFGRPLIP